VRPFEELTQAGRYRRIRQLALAALPTWGLQVRSVTPLTYWENATWRVDADEGRFLLRVHRPHYRSQAQIAGELDWLRALREHGGIPAQQPVGGPVLGEHPGAPEPRWCTLLTWADGRLHKAPGLAKLRAAAHLQARLHHFAEHFREPLVRPVWDTTDVFRMPTTPRVLALLDDGGWQTWRAGLDRLAQLQDQLGRGPDQWGLVHLDLHFSNLVFTPDAVVPIDFDDGGWGSVLMDFATPYARIHRLRDGPELWRRYLAAYRELRPLDPDHAALIPELADLESLMLGGWLDPQGPRPQTADWPAVKFPEFVAALRARGL